MTHFNLQQLKEMREGITKGEWQHMNEDNLDVKTYVFAPSGVIAASVINADAELIASAPSILSDLIEALETLKTFGVESGKFGDMYNHVSGEGRKREREELKKRIEGELTFQKHKYHSGEEVHRSKWKAEALSDILSMLDGERKV